VTTDSSIRDAAFAERPRVLLADDHPAMLALTADVLASECLVVGSVGDGRELLAEAERLHLDEHAYELGAIDTSMPFAELKRLSHINDRARAADGDPAFSSRIRDGLPGIQ
jgi:CheY-like chemotaxis protein